MAKRKKCAKPREDYKAKFTRIVAQRQKNQPVKISKHYLSKAIEKINKSEETEKRQHPVIERYGEGGAKCLKICASPSMNVICRSLLPHISYVSNFSVLVSHIRTAILSQNWSFCIRLYGIFLEYGALRRRQLLYLLRVTFLILFNAGVTEEKLDKFLTVTLSIRDPDEKIAYLHSLIDLREFSQKSPPKNELDSAIVAPDKDDDSGNE